MKIQTVSFDLNKFVPKFSPTDVITVSDKQDKYSDALTEVDFKQVDFITCRNPGQKLLTGIEQFTLLKETGRILYGASVFMGLWKDYQAKGEDSVLEHLYRQKQIISIDFFGDVILNAAGEFVFWLRRVPINNTWDWLYGWMGLECLEDRLSAVSVQ